MAVSVKQAAKTVATRIKAHGKALDSLDTAQGRVVESFAKLQEALKSHEHAVEAAAVNGKAVAVSAKHAQDEEE